MTEEMSIFMQYRLGKISRIQYLNHIARKNGCKDNKEYRDVRHRKRDLKIMLNIVDGINTNTG